MRFQIILLAVLITPLFLAGCGGENAHPYDGTWEAVYPSLSSASSVISDTEVTLCSAPPATLIIKDAAGTTTQSATCQTTITTPAISGVPATTTVYPPQIIYANIGVSIRSSDVAGEKDVINAVVNGSTLTGQCISTAACAAVSAAGDTLSLTR